MGVAEQQQLFSDLRRAVKLDPAFAERILVLMLDMLVPEALEMMAASEAVP